MKERADTELAAERDRKIVAEEELKHCKEMLTFLALDLRQAGRDTTNILHLLWVHSDRSLPLHCLDSSTRIPLENSLRHRDALTKKKVSKGGAIEDKS